MTLSQPYPLLFSPFELGGRRLKNRVVHASISLHFGAEDGLKQAQLQYYANRARGGAGMIVSEPVGIAPHQGSARVCAWNDSMAGELARWAEVVEREDCRLLAQVQDTGRGWHLPGRNFAAIGASPLPDDLSGTMPRPLTRTEIAAFVEAAAQSSARLARCGFSGVEISAGHGHLLHQFLSPHSNRREDEYGGDLAGRTRLLVELAAAIRSACGRGFIVGVKLPGDDGIAGSIPPALAAQIAARLVRHVDVDYLCYVQGTHHRSLEMHIPDGSYGRVPYIGLIRQLRRATPGVPVIALGRITDPAEAERILADGDGELVGLGRALIADAAWPLKAQAGRVGEIRACTSGNTCWKTIVAQRPLACDNNPRLGAPHELDARLPVASRSRKVLVVGAGVGGLEGALTAAARGHEVTLLGSSAEPGGKTRLHARLPNSEALASIYDHQVAMAQRSGVRFELGTAAGAERIVQHGADIVALATGATMTWPVCLPDALRSLGVVPDLRTAIEPLLARKERQRGVAVILDLDHTEGTYAAAELLRALFERVVLLTPRAQIAEETALVTRQRILRRFHELNIEARCLVEPRWSAAFELEGRLEYASIFGGASRSIEEVSFFAYATPRTPNDALVEPLRAAGLAVHRIGDCKVARDVLAATAEGFAVGMSV